MVTTMRLLLEKRPSPLGPLLIVSDENAALRALDFADYEPRMHKLLRTHYQTYELTPAATPAAITQALDAYFDGDFKALSGIRVATGGTDFQREVWQVLRNIPAGETRSYGQLAMQINRANASRAVGLANGSNPIAIVVPCHRVIGASGKLTGYAGGLARKRWLIDHEHRQH